MRRLLSACLAAALFAPAVPAFEPADLLPPAPAWQGASEALIAPADHPWVTPAELTGLTDSPDYAATLAWLEKLAAASPRVRLHEFGRTAQGRPLLVVLASRDGAATPAALAAGGRPTVLAQAGIHSGEIDGKDAGLMLLRDLAFTGKAALLDRANFALIVALNADGHERRSRFNRPNQRGPVHQGWRTTAQNLNLNRDYMKADAPELRALLGLLGELQPSLYLDIHVTDGIDYAYDITYGFNGAGGTFAWSPAGAAWLDRVWRPAADAALAAAGHLPGPLVFAVNNRDLTAGIGAGPSSPRFSHGYGDLRHVPSVLVENHSLKPYRQRVLGTYVLYETSLRAAGEDAAALASAIATDRSARPSTLALNWNNDPDRTVAMDFRGIAYEEYDSPVSGTREVRWLGTPKTYAALPVHQVTRPRTQLARPAAYLVPPEATDVIARLRAHGIGGETLPAATTRTVTLYRLVDPKPAAQPFEGRHRLATAVRAERREETFPAGTFRVPTDQPLGDLAIALLEPASDDSFLAWGFFPGILQRTEYIEGYAIAPLAEQMLAADPRLKAEFEARLAADAKFRASPDARLRWFYERSPFYDARHLLYPVGVEQQ